MRESVHDLQANRINATAVRMNHTQLQKSSEEDCNRIAFLANYDQSESY